MQATNAASSGVKVDAATLKILNARSDGPGVRYLVIWTLVLLVSGAPVALTLGSAWVWLALIPFGVALTVPVYALSHETAHKTAFKTKWLNEVVFYASSFLYGEEPIHRRFSHINHHNATWHAGKDSQMPFDTPMGFGAWLREVSSLGLWLFHAEVMARLITRRLSPMMRAVIPANQVATAQRNAIFMCLGYALLLLPLAFGVTWTLWFIILPRIIGGPVMLAFTILQHAELQENDIDIRSSTRSFKGSWWASFLYMNMENHIEHHLYSSIPFHALPKLREALVDQVPAPDPGFLPATAEVLSVVIRRSLGKPTKAKSIRQAPHMVTQGGPVERVSSRSM